NPRAERHRLLPGDRRGLAARRRRPATDALVSSRPAGIVSRSMADDWRVTATLHDPDFVDRLLQRLRRHELEEGGVERLGGGGAVSTGPTHVFVYADSEGAARQAERVLRDVCAAHGFEA